MSSRTDADSQGSSTKWWLLGAGVAMLLPVGAFGVVIMLVVLTLGALGGGSAQAATSCAVPGVVVGGTNVDTAMKTLMSTFGLKPHQAAGMVGNFMVEGGPNVDPKIKNELGYTGIVQWDPQYRFPELMRFAAHLKADPHSIDAQLRFVAFELGWANEWPGQKGAYADVGVSIKAASTSDEAAKIAFDSYEIPGDSSLPKRQDYARGLAKKYAGGAGPAPSASSTGDTLNVADVNITTTTAPAGSGGWRVPTTAKYSTSSGFGPRSSPGGVGSTNHQGIDLVLPKNGEIVAAAAGTAKIAQTGYFGLGTAVILDHGGGWATTYGHMSRLDPALKPGVQVQAGQRLGWQGSTGNSTGDHLHFGIQQNGVYVNPVPAMAAKGAPLNGTAGSKGTVGKPAVDAAAQCTPAAAAAGGDVPKGFAETLKSYVWADHAPDGRLTPTPGYATAVQRASASGRFYGKQSDEASDRPPGIHCSGFLSLFMTDSGFDPTYNYGGKLADGAGFVGTQKAWMEKNWQRVGGGSQVKLTDLRPGDVGISNGSGFYHVWMFVGKVDGINGNFVEASYKYSSSPGFAPQARQSAGVLYANQADTTYYRKKA